MFTTPKIMRFKLPTAIFATTALLCASFYLPGQDLSVVEASPRTGERVPSCIDNYTSWNSSTSRKTTSDWDITYIPYSYDQHDYKTEMHQFSDINGDGLVDFLYLFRPATHGGGPQNVRGYCVALNNGTGWDVVYQCVHKGYSSTTYYGDCAA